MTTLDPRITAAFFAAEPEPEPEASDLGRHEPAPYDLGITEDPEVTRPEIRRDGPEAAPVFPAGLYGSGMHEYVLDEIELGPRAAACADAEACGYSPLSPEPEPEAEWDSADSNACQARVEAGLEPEDEPAPYTLTPRAEAVLASWDRFRALELAERLAPGEPEPEAEP